MTKYVESEGVDAVQFTGTNFGDIVDFVFRRFPGSTLEICGGLNGDDVFIDIEEAPQSIEASAWLVYKDVETVIQVFNDENFKKKYSPDVPNLNWNAAGRGC